MSTKRRNNNKLEEFNLPDNERLPLQQTVMDFINSGESELVLSGLSNIHRKYLHGYAARMGLKSRSNGKKTQRVLHITRRRRNLLFTDAHKLELNSATRRLLTEWAPTIRSCLLNNNQKYQPQHQQKSSRLRGEALLLNLGTRLVPPRPNRISKELFRDKQELPIFRYQDEINKMLRDHSIFIINGETGSGKTTQVPQYILNECTRKNRPCRIVVTQPRRVAAVSVSHRVAEERGEDIGETVGYQIRMESRVRKTTNLIYTTSGCLLRSIMADVKDLFGKITHLIIDEIHERDKYTDFTLITVKEQLKHNKDLKIILMSATMDINLLSKYFDDCPVLNVPGQGYDVKIYHLEDILFHTGYRTDLMSKYLRSSTQPVPTIAATNILNGETQIAGVRLPDEYFQEVLDNLLDQCSELGRSEEELCEKFDQIQYYIDSEGMPVDAAHTRTGITPLMAACICNYPKYVQIFLQRHANVHIIDSQGFSAANYALQHSDDYCMSILASSGLLLQQLELNQEDLEKQRILGAYQQQFNDDNEVDHDLILSLLEGLYRSTHPGAIMVFLPGYNDIVQQRDLLNSTLPSGTYRICILHGQMDSKDQFEALKPQYVRKIILSTNIGQTSITIPDLAYIIDSGKVKMKTYDSITESSQLQSVWISQADANQRSGRAGRTQNGVCYRLYSLAKYQFMPKFSFPEFMRIPLTEICLYAKTLDAACDVQSYLSRAMNAPSILSVQNAIKKLQILEVFNDDESVTDLGRHLVEIPLDVQLGKCLLYSIFLKCFDPVLTIVAFHSVKDPFILPTDRAVQGQASYQRKSLAGKSFSDQMGILELYKNYTSVRNNRKRLHDFCSKYFLSQSAMEMFCATRRQIAELVSQKFRLGQQATLFNNDWNMVRFCLVAGFYPNIAAIDRKKNTIISGADKQLILQRTSALNPPGKKNLKDFIDQLPHDWIVFYEKSRVGNLSSINMNTVVSSVVLALQCGRVCNIEEDSSDVTDDSEDNDDNDMGINQKQIVKNLHNLSVTDDRNAIMYLDDWIKFEISSSDAKLLAFLRNLLHTQFLKFLSHGHTTETATVANCVQKLLSTLENATIE